MTGAEAICAGISATNDHHTLAGRQNFDRGSNGLAQTALVRLGQEFHREVDSLQFAARNLQVAWMFRSAGQYDGVKFTAQILDGDIVSDLSVGNELHAFGRHLLQAAIDDVFRIYDIQLVGRESMDGCDTHY